MKEEYSQIKPTANKEHCRQGCKKRPTFTLNQLKLSVAAELRAAGYTRIKFDHVVEACGIRVKVHVLDEDEISVRLAVYCISDSSKADPYDLLGRIKVINAEIEDCEVALAFPIALLPKIEVLIGLTKRFYMVDDSGMVWVHYPCDTTRKENGDMAIPPGMLGSEETEQNIADKPVENAQMRLFYVA